MKKLILIFFVFLFIGQVLYAQLLNDTIKLETDSLGLFTMLREENSSDKNKHQFVRFETPTVASFTKFIDHPVSLYTGTPDMSIPIYTLKDGVIEIPIVLRYNSSGIKVSEEASWVGLGWNLNVGGVIVQNMVGRDDNTNKYYGSLDYTRYAAETIYNPLVYNESFENKHDQFFLDASLDRLQPDVFYFSYPGYSGKFFIDHRTGDAHQLKKEKPIKINYDFNTKIYKITTETGIIHTFANVCIGDRGNQNYVSRTYYLTNSKYPNGQEVNYTYTEIKQISSSQYENQVFPIEIPIGINISGWNDAYTSISTEVESKELILSTVQTGNYKIEFITSSRNDLIRGLKLDELKISKLKSESEFKTKSFKFTYDYFLTQGDLGEYYTRNYSWGIQGQVDYESIPFDIEIEKRRLKLLSVHESTNTSEEHNKHSFEYYPAQLPVKTSYASDYWGYYNGEIMNTSFTPDFSMLLRTDLGDKLTKWQRYKANKAYHFESCLAGMLKKTTYPTGGHFIYTYEPNKFKTDRFIPTKEELEKEVKNTIIDRNYSADERTYTFNLTTPTRCEFNFRVNNGFNSWSSVLNSKYTLIRNGVMYKTETAHSPMNTSDLFVEQKFSLELPVGSYTLSVDIPDELGNQNGWDLNHGEATISIKRKFDRNYSIGAGLRIAKLDFYESPDAVSSKYTVEYKYPNEESNGILHSPIEFHKTYNANYALLKKGIIDKPSTDVLLLFSLEEVEISSNSYISSPYSTHGLVGYNSVKEIIKGASDFAGYKVYNFANNKEMSASISYQIPRPENGTLTKIDYYKNDILKPVKSEIFNYSENVKNHYCGVSSFDTFNRTPIFFTHDGTLVDRDQKNPLANLDALRYTILLYPLISYETLLNSKITTIDGIETKETYEYNEHGLRKSVTTLQSDKKSNISYITYPTEYSCEIFQTMQNKNMLAFPVEERQVVDGKLVNGKLTQYKLSGINVVPSSISFAVNTTNSIPNPFSCTDNMISLYPQKNIQFHTYDKYSNLIHFTRDDAENIVYLWSYSGQYPIAEIKNAKYEEVEAAVKEVFSVANVDSLSALSTPNEDILKDGSLQKKLPNALVTTYTYKPLVGMTTMTDPCGVTTTYEYDDFGRLKWIKDNNSNLIEEYKYHYRKENE